jgi:hypothetical protein
MCEPKEEVKTGDNVRETDGYRMYCKDREVRGEVISIRHELAVVRNIHGWETCLHKSWLEVDHDHSLRSSEAVTPIPTPWIVKPWMVKWPKTQKFCQHCGEKL